MIDRAADVLDPRRGILEVTRLATASSLVGGVEGEGHEPFRRQPHRVVRADLLLHTAAGRCDDQRREGPVRLVTPWHAKIAGQRDRAIPERHAC